MPYKFKINKYLQDKIKPMKTNTNSIKNVIY